MNVCANVIRERDVHKVSWSWRTRIGGIIFVPLFCCHGHMLRFITSFVRWRRQYFTTSMKAKCFMLFFKTWFFFQKYACNSTTKIMITFTQPKSCKSQVFTTSAATSVNTCRTTPYNKPIRGCQELTVQLLFTDCKLFKSTNHKKSANDMFSLMESTSLIVTTC